MTLRFQREIASEIDGNRAVQIGAHELCTRSAVALHHFGIWMAEATAIADRDDRPAWRHGGDESRRRRGPAAVMRHEQHIGFRRAPERDHLRFSAALDVAG